MHALSTNQIAGILHYNDNIKYRLFHIFGYKQGGSGFSCLIAHEFLINK